MCSSLTNDLPLGFGAGSPALGLVEAAPQKLRCWSARQPLPQPAACTAAMSLP